MTFFLPACLRHIKIPKVWRRALVVAISQPKKPVEDPKSYRPISLLCVPYKILERLIHARVVSVVDPLLPREQAGFRRGRSSGGYWVRQMRQLPGSPPLWSCRGAPFNNGVCSFRLFCGILKWALGLNNRGSAN